jgi:WD40 repeat protein
MEKSGRKAAPPPEPTAVLRGHETAVNAVALCVPPPSAAPQQPLLVSGDAGGAVCLWSLRTKRRLQVEPTAHSLTSGRRATAASGSEGEGEGGVQQVAFVASGQQVLTQGRGYSSCVKLWATERLGTGGGSGSTATFPVATLAFCKLAVLERSSSSGTYCLTTLASGH